MGGGEGIPDLRALSDDDVKSEKQDSPNELARSSRSARPSGRQPSATNINDTRSGAISYGYEAPN